MIKKKAMIQIQQIKLPLKHSGADIEKKIRKILRLKPDQNLTYHILKQSIDARRKNEVCYVYTVEAAIDGVEKAEKIIKKLQNKNVQIADVKKYEFESFEWISSGRAKFKHRPVIAGSGPAGLFCAYQLARCGCAPIILERGRMVEERQKDVIQFWLDGRLNPASNVQFGEGGAGTFSDGKLNTLVKDPSGRNRYVLETFVSCGADSSILYVNKPHIGTDVLIHVVRNLREEIIRLGGTFYFETCLSDIHIKDGRLCSLTVTSKDGQKQLSADQLILAVGHSARDTFQMLSDKGFQMEAKSFAVGFRVEHPQHMINVHQYKGADMRYLPAASYKVTAPAASGRGVYSFCMCPGGYVVNASSEEHRLAVNGMSYHKRDGANANSAVIVSVSPADFPDPSPLGGMAFQRDLEAQAYSLGGGRIPQQLYGDYVSGKLSTDYGDFASQTKGESVFANLGTLLPPEMKQAFICGMERFAGYIPGFNRYDTILSGIESRTSSPVRILRNEQLQSSIQGVYPCGEGAGYAGGIMSAAMDGLKTAEAVMKNVL